MPIEKETAKSVTWAQAAAEGQCSEIDIFLTAPSAVVSGWPGKRAMQTTLIGKLALDCGEQAWVVHRTVPVPQISIVQNGATRWFNGCTQQDLRGETIRAVAVGVEQDGSRWLLETAVETGAG